MKIAMTVSDFGAYMHTGANVEYLTCILEIDDEQLPPRFRDAIDNHGDGRRYETVNFSLFKEIEV